LFARVLDWIEAEAGITAAELGLGCYAAGRGKDPTFGADDDGTRGVMQMAYDTGYLAAVRRFAPTFYPFVQRELDRAHGFNPLTAAAIGNGEARS
jgi:hypothetical protein